MEFSDGMVKKYCANVIAQHLYNIVEDSNIGRRSLEAILDHESSIESKHKSRNIFSQNQDRKESKN